jgi:nucleotide-binding universal stress UspA family protein
MDLALKSPGSELHIVHAIAASADPDDASHLDLGAIEESAEGLRDSIAATWPQNRDIEVVAHVCIGDTAKAILSAAIDLGADVIVVGSHRRSPLQRLIGRSVGEHVLREAHCPVLIAVTKDYEGVAPHIDPACDDCLRVRAESGQARVWCERHEKPYAPPHVYVPRQDGRSTMLPTY